MEKDPKIQQAEKLAYFPTMIIGREDTCYGYYPYLSISRLRAVGAFIWHISYELGSADDYNQRKHINIFALKTRIYTKTDDGSEVRLDKIKRMMNMIMMNIAPLVSRIARKQPFKMFYPDIVSEFYMWNLCSPFCMFVTDLRKRFSRYSRYDFTNFNRPKLYRELYHAIFTHMRDTYLKLKTRSNFYLMEPFLWDFSTFDGRVNNPVNIAINKIQREEFARSIIKPPEDLRISKADFINTTLSLLLNDVDIDDNFHKDYCRYILNRKITEYKGNIEELCNQDPKDENKIIDYVFDEAEKILNAH